MMSSPLVLVSLVNILATSIGITFFGPTLADHLHHVRCDIYRNNPVFSCMKNVFIRHILGRSLMIQYFFLQSMMQIEVKKILKSWKDAHSSNFLLSLSLSLSLSFSLSIYLSLCVCLRAAGHTFWPRNLVWMIVETWERNMFSVFRNFNFYVSYWYFSIFFPI